MLDEILKVSREISFDFRELANSEDPDQHLFEEWIPYYRLKYAISKIIRPRSILEIGMRGYSAQAFLAATPSARFLGLESDSAEDAIEPEALEWAREALARYDARIDIVDTRTVEILEGGPYGLIHLNGRKDGDGTLHDIRLALEKGRYILVDHLFGSRQSLLAATFALEKYSTLIEYAAIIPGYAGQMLIKTNPDTESVLEMERTRKYGNLQPCYSSEYYLRGCGGYEIFKRTSGNQLDARLEAVLHLLASRPGDRVLDIGCGRGELAYAIAEMGADVTAADYSSDAIRIAQTMFGNRPLLRGGRLRLIQADAVLHPFESQFDLVLATDVVEHIEQEALERLFAKVSGLLTPAGQFLVHTAPNQRYFEVHHKRRVDEAAKQGLWLPRNPRLLSEDLMHINEQTPESLEESLRRHFGHVLVWTSTLPDIAGTLVNGASLRNDFSIFAIASSSPISRPGILDLLSQRALDPAAASVEIQVLELPKFKVDRLTQIPIRLRNLSATRLTSLPPNPIVLAYHWRDQHGDMMIWDGERTVLRRPVHPHETQELEVVVRSPPHSGSYRLELTLVQEGMFWFEQHSKHLPLALDIAVT